jgi:dihydroorotase-like cyclic amidohydrolase
VRFETEITNATIVTPEGRYRGTISVADGRIAAILEGPSGSADHTIEHVPTLWEGGVAMFKAFTCTTHGVPDYT